MSQSFARRNRRAKIAKERQGTTLDALNERLAERDLHLHPTRGYRKINPKRTVAQTIVEMALQGFGGETVHMKEALQDA